MPVPEGLETREGQWSRPCVELPYRRLLGRFLGGVEGSRYPPSMRRIRSRSSRSTRSVRATSRAYRTRSTSPTASSAEIGAPYRSKIRLASTTTESSKPPPPSKWNRAESATGAGIIPPATRACDRVSLPKPALESKRLFGLVSRSRSAEVQFQLAFPSPSVRSDSVPLESAPNGVLGATIGPMSGKWGIGTLKLVPPSVEKT